MLARIAHIVLLTAPLLCARPAFPDTAEDYFARAAQLAQQGKTELAQAEYQAGLKLRPGDTQAWNNLAVLYFQMHDLARAIPAFERARKLDPQNSEINFNLGLAYFQTEKPQLAIDYLTRASD